MNVYLDEAKHAIYATGGYLDLQTGEFIASKGFLDMYSENGPQKSDEEYKAFYRNPDRYLRLPERRLCGIECRLALKWGMTRDMLVQAGMVKDEYWDVLYEPKSWDDHYWLDENELLVRLAIQEYLMSRDEVGEFDIEAKEESIKLVREWFAEHGITCIERPDDEIAQTAKIDHTLDKTSVYLDEAYSGICVTGGYLDLETGKFIASKWFSDLDPQNDTGISDEGYKEIDRNPDRYLRLPQVRSCAVECKVAMKLGMTRDMLVQAGMVKDEYWDFLYEPKAWDDHYGSDANERLVMQTIDDYVVPRGELADFLLQSEEECSKLVQEWFAEHGFTCVERSIDEILRAAGIDENRVKEILS